MSTQAVSLPASRRASIRKYRPVYMIMIPGLLFYLIFYYLPMIGSIIAFKDISPWDGWQGIFTAPWVGLKWFRKLFASRYFGQLMGNTLAISGLKLLFGFPLPILLALLLNEVRCEKYKRVVQTVSYLPHFISMVVLCGITHTLFSTSGVINQIYMSVSGNTAINFIGSTKYFRMVLVTMYVWASIGWNSIIYLASISSIDPQLYEAAMVDGAGKWRQAIHITLPSIAPTIVIMLIINVGGLMNAGFEQVLLLYSPSVYSVGDIIDTYVYREGLINLNYSYTTAVSMFKSVVAMVLMLGTNFIAKSLGQEGIWQGDVQMKTTWSRGNKLTTLMIYVVLGILFLLFVLPFLLIISTSFIGSAESSRRGAFILLPQEPTVQTYQQIVGSFAIYRAYGITLSRVIIGTTLNMVVSSTLAFGLSKHDLPGRNTLITMIFITMVLVPGLIPSFFVNKMVGVYDTFWVMIFPSLVNTWNMIILKNFFVAVPKSLEESAEIDGASILRRFFQIVVPVSIPAIATISMYYAVWHWNAWFDAAIYINNNALYPVQVLLRNIVLAGRADNLGITMGENAMSVPPAESLKCAVIVVSTLPILCVYPFIQRYFVKGVMVGAVKG